jgi:hypothetical protein
VRILCARLGVPKTKIDHVGNFCVVLGGNVDAKFNVLANISGQISSGSITLFQIGIPGLSIPGYVGACLSPNK